MSPFEPYVPEDFDEFWLETLSEAEAVPLDYRRSSRNDFDLEGFVVEIIDFRGMQDRTVHGWLAYPEGGRRLPGFVWLPPYGRESLLPNEYGTRAGYASLSLNFHGHDAFHQEKYQPARGYFAEGIGDPRTWIFRRIFQDSVIATKVLMAQIEVDEERIGAMGLSQGGGLAIWLGAWCGLVRAVCADLPFLSAMKFALSRNAHRYPLKEVVDYMQTEPLGPEKVWHTLSYFDTLNQATRCMKPTHLSLGLKDPAVRPESVEAVYRALPGIKELSILEGGHDWHSEMVAANRAWFDRHLA